MACTFNGLDLEELGTVGNQEVEYARFDSEVSNPAGYDGGVLVNFHRGPTVVRFDLALTGTESERINKMNMLAAELAKGQGELVMPSQSQGYHLDAVPNTVLKPSVYHDGFVLPLEFTVPDGCAIARKTATIGASPATVEVGGHLPARWSFSSTGSAEFTPDGAPDPPRAKIVLSVGSSTASATIWNSRSSYQSAAVSNVSADSDACTLSARFKLTYSGGTKTTDWVDIIPGESTTFGEPMQVGENTVSLVVSADRSLVGGPFNLGGTLRWTESSVW